MARRIKITQVRSIINRHVKQKRTIKALGLHHLNHSVVHKATPQIQGMVEKVKHLVQVEEIK